MVQSCRMGVSFLWWHCVGCCRWIDREVASAAKFEELRVGAVFTRCCEWLRSALSKILSGELRALAAAGGVETQPNRKWLTVAELRSALVKVLVPSTEVGCVKNGF